MSQFDLDEGSQGAVVNTEITQINKAWRDESIAPDIL
jgi:hypothetical protein